MAVRVVCRACGKRLKVPAGAAPARAAKCPKCGARVDLSAELEATAYMPAVFVPKPPGAKVTAPPAPKPPTRPLPAPTPATQPEPLSLDDDGPLSLDDDPAPPAPPAPGPPPFRVPVRVRADSARQYVGPCFAVFVPHGLFLELEPLKPFLYVPIGCRAESPEPGELAVALPDRRLVTVQIETRYAVALAADACAFLAGRCPAPVAADYARPWWPVLLALALVIGVAAAILVAVLHFAGRGSVEAVQTPPVPLPGGEVPALPKPVPPDAPPEAGPRRPPSHVDRAYTDGVSALEDGPADVTALGLAPDGVHLGIGYADGTCRVWPLDQPTFDSMLPGPKVDGPVTRVQFDSGSRFLFVTSPTGVVAVPRTGSPPAPAKINGAFVAIAPELSGDRVRFAAARGNVVAHRLLPGAFVLNPPAKAKGFANPSPKDEVTPAGVTADPQKPPTVTFLAWTPGNRLLAGAPDGSVLAWSVAMKPEPANRDHKAPVKAWAACATTGNFATGDDKGTVAVWPFKGGKPAPAPVFTVPVTGLSFSPSGAWLAVADNTGWLAIVDTATLTVQKRKKLPAPVKALAFGPNDDVMILGTGKAVEVWALAELVK